ncbi:unnamed protein product, partial [Rotaria sp. Silwood2]
MSIQSCANTSTSWTGIYWYTNQLEQNTNFIIRHQYFTVPNSIVQGTPQLQSEINGFVTNHVYLTDFTIILFSLTANFDSFVRLVTIPNFGYQDVDWMNMSVTDSVASVKRGNCTFPEKCLLAEKYHVKGLLIFNEGTAPDRFQPLQYVENNMNATIPAYFLSYNLGMQFVNASDNVSIRMTVNVSDAEIIENICADTVTGDKTKTIVIGFHSDGVLEGSGINDNDKKSVKCRSYPFYYCLGSGTVGNLVLALNLARLLQTCSLNYAPYRYRVRFCWWGVEELGLLGSIYHVDQISLPTATTKGERLQDYLLYLNYDMLASPNNNFGILDSFAVPPATPEQALPGTGRITDLLHQWFNEQKLSWTKSSIGGGNDFIPLLTKDIAAGGINTEAGGIKSATERDQNAAMLGIASGGIANAAYDSCYHQQCDRITNINPFAYEKVVKAAAYALQYTGRLNDLEKWLYPQGR